MTLLHGRNSSAGDGGNNDSTHSSNKSGGAHDADTEHGGVGGSRRSTTTDHSHGNSSTIRTTGAGSPTKSRANPSITFTDPLRRRHRDEKVVGLGVGAQRADQQPDELVGTKKERYNKYKGDIPLEDDENYARSKAEKRPIVLVLVGYFTAVKIFLYYLISLSSLVTIGLSVGMTFYWYERFQLPEYADKKAGSMDWVLLGFAVITPLSLSVGIAFRRRERALVEISKFRSFAYQLFIAHCIWDWGSPPDTGRTRSTDIDWVDHADDVLSELISVGDEICRFLTLPTASRSRHRMTKSGRREAARTAEVAYRLYDSLYTRRFIELAKLSEKLKLAGLGASEASRMRQYERWMGDAIENLRMIKTYRTPQTLRSFARIFTTLMPPFFAPTYAQLAINLGSLPMGVTFAVVTSLCLNALLEGVEILEDPFVAFVTLDGIDVREEFQVLHWQQLVNARNNIFSEASPYGGGGQAKFFFAGDVETPGDSSVDTAPKERVDPMLNSEETHASRKKRHRSLLSLGDASFLNAINDDVESYRESGYQKLGKVKKRVVINIPPNLATPSIAVPKGNEDQVRPATY